MGASIAHSRFYLGGKQMSHVFVGMSGGVDSSVAALLLQKRGYQVSGVNLRLLCSETMDEEGKRHCGSAQDAEDARRVAQRLGFPFYMFDQSELFRNTVIRNFIEEYEAGRTPNPCVLCNREVKFGALLQQALEMGGEYLATGHYALLSRGEDGISRLKKAHSLEKDQSYMLYRLSQEVLSSLILPLGGLTKQEVRSIAEKYGLASSNKPDSQDICFVPNGDYVEFLKNEYSVKPEPGNFVSRDGRVLGQHAGLIRYTTGQRRGLGVSSGKPLYVIAKDGASNTVVLGDNSELFSDRVYVKDVNFISLEKLTGPMRAEVKIRYSQNTAPALIVPTEDGVCIEFDSAQRAPTDGQSAVFYDKNSVIGGGVICRTSENYR